MASNVTGQFLSARKTTRSGPKGKGSWLRQELVEAGPKREAGELPTEREDIITDARVEYRQLAPGLRRVHRWPGSLYRRVPRFLRAGSA